jgi:hypothetical protein
MSSTLFWFIFNSVLMVSLGYCWGRDDERAKHQ